MAYFWCGTDGRRHRPSRQILRSLENYRMRSDMGLINVISSASRALPLLPRFLTYRRVAPLGDQSARRGAAHGGGLRQAARGAA
jgi:hypothetical protein